LLKPLWLPKDKYEKSAKGGIVNYSRTPQILKSQILKEKKCFKNSTKNSGRKC